jgi:lipopolysaccharide biosynthesis protein
VTKARPLFKGHYQPHLPADLGFYDLRVPEVREQQAQMAKEYGIYGFCYYHYWFNGKRILERPFQEVFECGQPDFPFMLCWANENWTRAWDGHDKFVLLEQKYSEEDDRAHIQALIPYFKDKRYIRVNNKPVIAIYKTALMPDPRRTTEIWREEASRAGMELYICRFDSFQYLGASYLEQGNFDAAIDFQPFGNHIGEFYKMLDEENKEKILKRIVEKLQRSVLQITNKSKYEQYIQKKWRILDYSKYVDFVITKSFPPYKLFPGITPMWDNYARKKENYFIFKNATPEDYGRWLKHIVNSFEPKSPEENFVFINAWNEWAEGNHLEPCQRWGKQYLEKTKEAFDANG